VKESYFLTGGEVTLSYPSPDVKPTVFRIAHRSDIAAGHFRGMKYDRIVAPLDLPIVYLPEHRMLHTYVSRR
jgi:hypothetical protein